MFHARDGLFFERQADGSVRVLVKEQNQTKFSTVLSADGWASVVATVSARGETLETWNEARQYHNRI